MNGAIQRPIAFVALNDVMQHDYRPLIVRRALNFRRQATPVARQRFDTAAAKHINIELLEEHVAISPSTQTALAQACQRDDLLMQAVLSMWQQSQLPLARRMREFLQSKGLETVEFDSLKNGFLGARPQENMLALVNEFHTRNPSFNTYDIALMLCCVHGYLPGASAAPVASPQPPMENLPDLLAQLETVEPTRRTRWHNWLAEIQSMPLEAEEWDETAVRAFALAAQRLGEQRQRERHERRARLANALAILREQASNELDYFGFRAVREWDANMVGLNEASTMAEAVTNFYTELMAHRAGLQQPPAETRAAQIARRREIEALEDQAIATFERLDARFHGQHGEPATPATAEAEAAVAAPIAPVPEPSMPAESMLPELPTMPAMAMEVGGDAKPLFATRPNVAPVPVNNNRRTFFRRK